MSDDFRRLFNHHINIIPTRQDIIISISIRIEIEDDVT